MVMVELVGVSVVVLVILEVEEVVVVVAEGVVGVVVLLVVAAFPIEGGRGGHSTIEVIIPLVRSVPPPEYFFPQWGLLRILQFSNWLSILTHAMLKVVGCL